ncbi:MAG: GIY-YIG nuclease family protein [Bacteroidetes bacterium]|nr:GIY-YIG nuclease family protein [Bacteroidota bacterium]
MRRGGSVYIITNRPNGVLYTGVTSELGRRTQKHKSGFYPDSFSARYNLHTLVYYEHFDSIVAAIAREKQIKAGSRKKKIMLIESMNPRWLDLYEKLDDQESCG